MIKYAIPVIFLICMTAYEASAASVLLDCGNQFVKSQKSTKDPKINRIDPEQFKGLVLKLDITTYAAYLDFDWGEIMAAARELFGAGARVPKDPFSSYRKKWSELTGHDLKPMDIEPLSPEVQKFKDIYLYRVRGVVPKLKSELDNKEIEELFHKFQHGRDLFNKKKFRRAIKILWYVYKQAGNEEVNDLIKKVELALKKHTEEINKNSGFFRGGEDD